MTPQITDPPPARRSLQWVAPITRVLRRNVEQQPGPAVPAAVVIEAPVDDGEDLLRRLREAGL